MNRFLILFLVSILLYLSQILSAQENNIPKGLYWLNGCWQIEKSGTFEIWESKADILVGRVIKIEKNDTLTIENLKIYKKKDEVIYEATVPTQNDGRPIEFVLTQNDESFLLFENPQHDFPKKIKYRFVNHNQISATISGNNKKMDLNYYRTKQ